MMLEHICSKQYQLREKGLTMVLQGLPSLELPSRKDVSTNIKAVCQVLSRGLSDQVLPTFSLAVELLNYLLGPYSQKHRLVVARLEVLERFLQEIGTEAGGLSLEAIMEVTNVCLVHVNKMVRDIAVRITLDLYKQYGVELRRMLLPSRAEDSKNKTTVWKALFDGFDRIDGVPSDKDRKNVAQATQVAKQNEVSRQQDGMWQDRVWLAAGWGVVSSRMGCGQQQDGMWVSSRMGCGQQQDGCGQQDGVWSAAGWGVVSSRMGCGSAAGWGVVRAEDGCGQQDGGGLQQDGIKKLQSQLKVLRELTAKGPSLTHAAAVIEGHIPSHEVPEPSQEVADDASKLDMTCVFCGEKRVDFTGNNLEPHYLTECPMLAQCTHCSQVVEIPELKNHWLTECEEEGGGFKECPNCRVAIPTALQHPCASQHVHSSDQSPFKCLPALPPSGSTRRHGMEGAFTWYLKSCAMNPRSKPKDMHPSDLMPRPHPPPPHPDPHCRRHKFCAVPKTQTRK
eukprot:Em0131g8a